MATACWHGGTATRDTVISVKAAIIRHSNVGRDKQNGSNLGRRVTMAGGRKGRRRSVVPTCMVVSVLSESKGLVSPVE